MIERLKLGSFIPIAPHSSFNPHPDPHLHL
jgi:hypothetical protein